MDKCKTYVDYEVEAALGEYGGSKRYPPRLPKGAVMYHLKKRHPWDKAHGLIHCRSKGRTGAAVRQRLMSDPRARDVLLGD
jgi:hypothetical protein